MDRNYLYRRRDQTIGYYYAGERWGQSLSNADEYVSSLGKIIRKWDAP